MKKGKEFISMNPPINQMGNINPNISNKNEVQPFFFPNNMQNIQGMQNPMIQNMNQININQVPSNNQNINPNISVYKQEQYLHAFYKLSLNLTLLPT